MGFRFYLLSTILIATLFISGHLLGSIGIIKYIGVRFDLYGRPLGEEALTLGLIGFLFGMITGVTGIVVAVTILHKLVTDEWLFSKWLRCQDIDSDGDRLDVGVDEFQLSVRSDWGDGPPPSIGLASAW